MDPLARAIHIADRFRGSPRDHLASYKEWLHFCVLTPELHVVINFSLCAEPAAGSGPAGLTARILLMACVHSWEGGFVEIPIEHVQTRPGSVDLQMGAHRVAFTAAGFQVRAALAEPKLAVELQLRPISVPVISGTTRVGTGLLRWVAVPRLLARGIVRIGEKSYPLRDAPAYHDHNFGSWRWGENLGWRWGFALPTDPAIPWSVIFSEIGDEAHHRVRDCGAQLYHRPALVRSFQNRELHIDDRGQLPRERTRKLPRVMNLLADDIGPDLPERLTIRAEQQEDHLACEFRAQQAAQIFIPSEVGLGWTVINEVSAAVTVSGQLDGETFAFSGLGMFEYVHGAA